MIHPTPKQLMRIPVSQPSITDLERKYVYDAFERGQISGVPSMDYVQRFEDAWVDRIGRDYVDAVNSGTDALEVVLRALGIGAGDQVLVPAWTFAAPINAVLYVGATPVLVDVDPNNWTINPDQVMEHLSGTVKAIIAVDLFGHPCDFDKLRDIILDGAIQFSHTAPVPPYIIEDAAQAHGSAYNGVPTGQFGIASTFSLFANKGITTGEGGVILTSHPDLAQQIQLIRNHGMTGHYDHQVVGGNHRMNNLSAAIGLAQMERWDELLGWRHHVGKLYDAMLPQELGRRPVSEWAIPSTWLTVVTHPERDRLVAGLRAEGIDARPTWKALCDYPIYQTAVRGEYPVARKLAAESFVLPTYYGLEDDQVLEICHLLERLL